MYKLDYKEDEQELIDQLSITVNASFNELYDTLDNKVDFRNNISCTISEFNVTVDSNGLPTSTVQFPLIATQTTVEGLWVINAVGTTNSSILPTAGVYVSWVRNGTNILIKNVKGLQSGIQYKVKVIALG